MNLISWSLLLLFIFSLQAVQAQEANYEESEVPDYTLPEILKTIDGNTVESIREWKFNRRPEIIELFQKHVYGEVPQQFDSIEFKTASENKDAMGGTATARQIDIIVHRNGSSLTIGLNLLIPNQVEKPAPVTLLINHRGADNMDITRENKEDFWPAEYIIDRGYAAAVFDVEDVADDNAKTFAEDVIQKLYPEQLKKPDGMRGLSAWAWGAMRVMDYLAREPNIDQQRSIVIGHSRGGKAALWTGAQDERWAVTISNESGAGGAALSRRKFGETVQRINNSFPYWFTPNFDNYNDNESDLPVDQHMLIASMAPRAVYVASAEEDQWADPRGSTCLCITDLWFTKRSSIFRFHLRKRCRKSIRPSTPHILAIISGMENTT
ncbi:MAG: hypothetical protein U5K69_10820 [Balneolaceae bacterium]|nr:hypothetical protein [Balneolaceae bacterium]